MLLNDLIEHIPAQEEAISKLSDGVDSTSYPCVLWNKFREHFWGKPLGSFQKEEAVKRDESDPVNDIVLPDYHLVATLPEALSWGWGLPSEQFLVRSEYDETEQAVLSSNESDFDVFVVTGQDGIGPPLLSSLSTGSNT